jgi:hypothetical protein
LLRKEAAKWLREAGKDRHAAQILLEPEPSRSVFFLSAGSREGRKSVLDFSPDRVSEDS